MNIKFEELHDISFCHIIFKSEESLLCGANRNFIKLIMSAHILIFVRVSLETFLELN